MLHSIVRQGQQMLAEGGVKKKGELEKKLRLIQEQWASLVQRAQQRRAEIDRLVAQWLIYRSQKERLQVSATVWWLFPI